MLGPFRVSDFTSSASREAGDQDMRKIEGIIPTSYALAEAMLKGRERVTLAKNTVLVRTAPNVIGLKLHDTIVVGFKRDGSFLLNSGGWRTTTTKARINAAIIAAGWKVESVRGGWQVRGLNTSVVARYFDGIVLAGAA